MPVIWTHCLQCGAELKSSSIGGLSVKGCLACKRVCLAGDDRWLDVGKDTESELKARQELISRQFAGRHVWWQEAFDSDIDDPRWNT